MTFAGTWRLNVAKSKFDPKYVPIDGTVVFEPVAEGYFMNAEGSNGAGDRVQERPQHLILDGVEHPVPDIAGLTAVSRRVTSRRIEAEGRMNGQLVGKATYELSDDGSTLTATAQGTGANGAFETCAIFERTA